MNANPWSGLEVVATVFKQYLKPEQLITTVSIGAKFQSTHVFVNEVAY